MPDVTITPVDTGRRQRRFLRLPCQLYRDTPQWVPPLQAWGMREIDFSWVLESNHLSRRTLERGGALKTKTYRLYQST